MTHHLERTPSIEESRWSAARLLTYAIILLLILIVIELAAIGYYVKAQYIYVTTFSGMGGNLAK